MGEHQSPGGKTGRHVAEADCAALGNVVERGRQMDEVE
jgi:hypothetical protein